MLGHIASCSSSSRRGKDGLEPTFVLTPPRLCSLCFTTTVDKAREGSNLSPPDVSLSIFYHLTGAFSDISFPEQLAPSDTKAPHKAPILCA